MTKSKLKILTIEADKIPETSHKGIIVTKNLAVEVMLSVIFSITAVSLSFVMWQFMSNVYSSYFLLLTTLVFGQACLLLRRLRIPALFQIPAHLALLGIFSAVYYLNTDHNNFLQNVLPIALLLLANVAYSFYQLFKANTTSVKYDSLIVPLFVDITVSVLVSLSDDDTPKKVISLVLINALVTVVMFFIARQLHEFEEGYYHSMRSSSVPIKQIRKQNYRTVWGLVIVSVIGFAFALTTLFFVPIDSVIRYLFAGLIFIIKSLLELFGSNDSGESTEPENDLQMPQLDDATNSIFSQIVYWFLVIMFVAAALFALYLLIRYIASKILSRRIDDNKETIDSEYVTDIIETINVKPAKTHKKRDFGQGYEKSIRKAFYGKVKHAIRKGVDIKSSDSPQEISHKIEKETGVSIAELTEKYEEVRY